MSEWVHSTVGAVTTYQRAGGTPTATNNSFYGGDIPFVTIEDITNGTRFLDRTEKTLSEFGLANSAAWLLKEPHILYSMYATVGKPIINRITCATNQAIIALKESPEIDQSYLFYQLLFMRPDVYKYTAQTTQSNLNASSVKKLPISYPKDKREQRKIAAILSGIDTAIEKTEALIAKYQQIKAGLMHDLFTRGVLPNGQLRPPREQAPELYQETAIGLIPSDWKTQNIGIAIESIADGPFGSNLKTEHYVVDPGVRVVRLQNVAEYEYNDTDRAFVSDRHASYLLRNKVVPGDVLIAGLGEERYPVGRACCYSDDLSPAINKADCFRARCRPDVMENKFLMLLLNSELARKQIRRYEQGVTRPRINTGNLKRIDACIPSIEEQQRIVAKFEAAQSSIREHYACVEKLRQQKLGLMQDLLTGKIPVKVGAGETAVNLKELA